MNKGLILIKWPAMAATARWAEEAEVTGEEARAVGMMDLETAPQEALARALDPDVLLFPCGEEGLWALLRKVGREVGSGAMVDAARIPVLKLTRRLAGNREDDIYTADGRGCLLAVAEKAGDLAAQLCGHGVPATVIGRLTGRPGPVLVQMGGRILPLE